LKGGQQDLTAVRKELNQFFEEGKK